MGLPDQLDADDEKLLILARGSRARAGAAAGAAVRDDDGRTYAAASVELPSLAVSALQAAVIAAVASGARALEAAALVSAGEPDDRSLAALRDLACRTLFVGDSAGRWRATVAL